MEEQNTLSSLQARINELEAKQTELKTLIENKENEFGQKRAQFREIFLQKETELNEEVANRKIANEENTRLRTELGKISSERDNLKTAVLITETSKDDKFESMKSKYQEEITSLQAIMQDAVEETRQEISAKYEGEKLQLMKANKELEIKLVKYKEQLKEMKSKQLPQEEGNDGLFDVIPGAWKKPAAGEDTGAENSENLEDSMKKAQEHAETLRAIVMPLEEEIAALKAKLRNANEKITAFEAKEKKQAKSESAPWSIMKSQNDQTTEKLSNTVAGSNAEEMEEKVKELTQYLEAERSARTDLEMFVAVLNTQKGVLQEDADKLRRELHNVCRLLEQEKEEHVALKDTWEMANDRFLETQRMQKIENDKIKKLLTLEQHKQLEEELKTSPESVELLTPPSPATKKRFLSRKVQKQPVNRKEAVKTGKVNASEAKKTLSSLARGSKTNSSTPPSSILDAAVPQLNFETSPLLPSLSSIPCTVGGNSQQDKIGDNDILKPHVDDVKAFSDGEGKSAAHESSMKKYKSADDIETGVPSDNFGVNNEKSALVDHLSDRGSLQKEKIDWKSFEEAAKSSLSNEVDRSCAMCRNYEKQLQKLQAKNEELSEETSILSKKVKDEQEAMVVVKRAYEHLEQRLKHANEEAQAQINAAAQTQRNLESLLEEINTDIDQTKQETAKQVNGLMESRDSILAKFEQLQENCSAIQSSSIKQIEQAYSGDGELKGVQEKLQMYEAASKTKEEKLQSEIDFMKDRVMAEQVAKESMEELYQAEIESLGQEIRSLKKELDMQKQQTKQLEQNPRMIYQGTASNEVIAILEKQLQQSSKDKADLEEQLRELKSQLHSLNGQLNYSESVQRDFVKLSQSLQMELEEMKESQKEVRWEHDDDVSSFSKCDKQLVDEGD